MRLEGRVAIVTGGSRGLGAAIAGRLRREGARVAIMDLEATEERPDLRCHLGDVSIPADGQACVTRTLDTWGRIDILVNNAGISRPGVIHGEDSLESWRAVLEVNLTGAFLMTRAVLPTMMKTPAPSVIINVASIAAEVVNPVIHPGYAASKGGLISLTRHLAATHAKFGIRCNAISPAAVRTPMWDVLPEEVRSLFGGLHPLGVGEPEDVAALTAFLASDEARWITGAVLHIDGGSLCAGGLAAHAKQVVR